MRVSRLLSVAATVLLLGLMFEVCPIAHAAEQGSDRMLKNLIIDNTVTFDGHEFYRTFASQLEAKTASVYFDQVALREVRSDRSGNTILIVHHEAVVFQTTVYPADRYMEIKAKQAAAIVSGRISNEQLQGLLSQDGDLAGDEL